MKRLFLIFLFLLISCPAWGATYYVSQSGAGAKTGADVDNASEIATFNAGTAPYNALDDDTVYLLDTLTTPVTIPDGGTSGHVATIRGDYAGHPCTVANTTGQWSVRGVSKSYVTVSGFTIAPNNSVSYATALQIDGTTTDVTLSNLTIDMAGATAASSTFGIASSGAATNLTISGTNTITGMKTYAIYYYGANTTNASISGVTMTGRGMMLKTIVGLSLSNITANSTTAEAIRIESSSAGTISDVVTSSCQYGIVFVDNSHDFIVNRATVSNSTKVGLQAGLATGSGCYNITYNDCISNGNVQQGFAVVGSTYNVTYNNCHASSNGGNGFGIWNSPSNITYNRCVAHDNGDKTVTYDGMGFASHDTATGITHNYCIAYNNTTGGFGVANTSGTLTTYNCVAYNNGGAWFDLLGGSNKNSTRGNFHNQGSPIWTVKNSIAYNGYPYEYSNVTVADTLTFDYNLYYHPADTNVAKVYDTVYSWDDYHATREAHSSYADPLFVSNGINFHLQSGSPAKGAGVNVGLSNTSPPDIGAEPYKQYVPWR